MNNNSNEIWQAALKLIEQTDSFIPCLPLLFNLGGKPYSLKNHFVFEPMFKRNLPKKVVLKTGRQVSKTTTLAVRSLLMSAIISHNSILYAAPLAEQTRRYSNLYVKPILQESPIKHFLQGSDTRDSVFMKFFSNGSKLLFTYAFLSADRVRGISAHGVLFDEVQDLDPNHIPVILECLSASPWRWQIYVGTPKTLDNTMELLWSKSSMAEWVIKCESCNFYNIPSREYHLEKMIKPNADDVSFEEPGTICAKCGRSIYPHLGRWVHRHPQLANEYAGYHVPQILLPMHYTDHIRWRELLTKQKHFTPMAFWNDILAESYDLATKLISLEELRKACTLPWPNDLSYLSQNLQKILGSYELRILGIDWGGGGDEEISYTTVAVVGLKPGGFIDVIYAERLPNPNDHIGEAQRIGKLFYLFQCHYFAHDYNGAGSVRETILLQSGIPISKVIPIVYYRSAAGNLILFHKGYDEHNRDYWQLDKAKAILLVIQAIKLGYLHFFKFDYEDEQNRGLISDFLSISEYKHPSSRGGDVYTIRRTGIYPDDFVHSVTFATLMLWHISGYWPNFAKTLGWVKGATSFIND